MASARSCAAPGCTRLAPGRNNDFCAEHYFMVPRRYAELVRRYRIECSHANADDQSHLQEQLQSYIRLAVSQLPEGTRHA